MKLPKLKFKSLAGKNAFLMTLVGLIMLLFLSLLSPLFYHLTRDQLSDNISNTVRECAVRIGFLLQQHRPAKELTSNEKMLQLIQDYYLPDVDQQQIRTEMNEFLPITDEGHRENDEGVISSINYVMVTTSLGDCFCQEEMQDIAQSLISTQWYQEATKEEISRLYAPILYLRRTDGNVPYFIYIEEFTAGNILCYTINLTTFTDMRLQFSLLEELGMEDYQLIQGERVIYANQPDSVIVPSSYEETLFSSQQYTVNKKEQPDGYDFIVQCSMAMEGLYLIAHMSREYMMMPYQSFFGLLYLCLAALIGIMVVISCLITHLSLKRLTRLSRQMAEIQSGNYELHVQDDSADEIGTITAATNTMLSRIHEDIAQQLNHEEEEKKMQYMLLVSAMDPHYIYNTLDTVSFLAAMGKNQEVIAVNDALIATLKDRIKMKNYKLFDTVAVEKEVVQQYMLIQSYLCHNHIDFSFVVSPADLTLQIPKNMIQPLVENAIKHGLLTHKDPSRLKVQDGEIIVSVQRCKDCVEIRVEDNGNGMDPKLCQYYMDAPDDVEISSEHIGILNMKKRLHYLYKDAFSLCIQSAPQQGTRVTITIPLS